MDLRDRALYHPMERTSLIYSACAHARGIAARRSAPRDQAFCRERWSVRSLLARVVCLAWEAPAGLLKRLQADAQQQRSGLRRRTQRQLLMAFKPLRDKAIGPIIVTAAIVGWLLALALLVYIATLK
jgi:hypothetical protein